MNNKYIVIQWDLNSNSRIIGMFPSYPNAFLFVKQLVKDGIEFWFDILKVQETDWQKAIEIYKNQNGEGYYKTVATTNVPGKQYGWLINFITGEEINLLK